MPEEFSRHKETNVNDVRIKRGRDIIETHAYRVAGFYPPTVNANDLMNLLVDVQHFARGSKIDFEKAIDFARVTFKNEV